MTRIIIILILRRFKLNDVFDDDANLKPEKH